MTNSQQQILQVLREHGPMPDAALVPLAQHVAQAHMSSSSIRTRRAELARAGRVQCVDQLKMPSGRMAAVWAVTA